MDLNVLGLDHHRELCYPQFNRVLIMTIDDPCQKRVKLSLDDENKESVSPMVVQSTTLDSLRLTMAEDWQQAFAKEFDKNYFKMVLHH